MKQRFESSLPSQILPSVKFDPERSEGPQKKVLQKLLMSFLRAQIFFENLADFDPEESRQKSGRRRS
ncbi:MAG: hypothetical protein B5M48_03605 [Candidatus Omnitrophica bacterium 4484_213]|nr:MAG: hypothetical protein B5M48_03605 [Candidatus Omnitrophica bacterium 4484_213]